MADRLAEPEASKTMAGAVLDLFTMPSLLAEVKEEHTKEMQGRTYKCAVPDDIGPPLDAAREQTAKQG